MSNTVLVTGATGFVGRAVVKSLLDTEYAIIVAVRDEGVCFSERVRSCYLKDISVDTNWNQVVEDVDVIIHLAARVHIMNDDGNDPLSSFREVNTEGALNLARQAAEAGVERFIFLSSIGVNGKNHGVSQEWH